MHRHSRGLAVALAVGLLATACSRSDDGAESSSGGSEETAAPSREACEGVTLEATDTGVTADSITIQVMADTGSPLAPGLFQGNIDAIEAFASFVNDNGGIACRTLEVETWDSKLTPDEGKNGQLNACTTALAMVGGNSLFNPDVTALGTCPDATGDPIGLPNVAALANDINEQCAPNTYSISAIADTCPPGGGVPTGERQFTVNVGQVDSAKETEPDLVGFFMVPGDLPTTVQSATYNIAAQADHGVDWAMTAKVSGRDEQAAYTPRVQEAKGAGVTYVYNGSNDAAMVTMRKEAAAQGFEPSVWMCSTACYTESFKSADGVDGTVLFLPFLPFEDEGSNQELDNYLSAIGTPDSFGAQAWAAGVLFKQAVDQIVETDGPNAVTRASVLDALASIDSFDANGWLAARNPKGGPSDCLVMLRFENGEFTRTSPTEQGTFECMPSNLAEVTLDPVVAAQSIQ